MTPEACRTADDVDALAAALYPGADLARGEGVLHVTALFEPSPGAPLVTLRIGPHSPKSAHDAFALNLARARVDTIVTTGKMLRDEPETRYDLGGPGTLPDALLDWRRARAGRDAPPFLVVLTRGNDLPLGHPALHGAPRPLVFTTPEPARALADAGLDAVGVPDPSARAAIAHVRAERDARLVSIEAGPSTSRGLYEPDLAIDELLLTLYREPLDPALQGGLLPSLPRLAALLPHASLPVDVREPSGTWTFVRRTR